MPGSSPRPDDAVTVSVGYIIVFGIVLTTLAIVFASGFPVYLSYVDQGHLQNMIEGFDLVSENANNVAMLRTPYQQSELKLYDGTIALKAAGNIMVECFSDPGGNNAITPTGSFSASFDSMPLTALEYTKGTASIAYVMGGVFSRSPDTYPVIKEPGVYTYDRKEIDPLDGSVVAGAPVLVIPIISLEEGQFSLAGKTLARVSFGTLYYSKKNQLVPQPELRVYDHVQLVKITLQGDYSDSLCTYFHDDLGFQKNVAQSINGDLVMEKTCAAPGITVNTIQSFVVTTINAGSV